MKPTVADLSPQVPNAKRQFVELYGSALVTNSYLLIALVLMSLVALGLVGLNVYTANRYAHIKPLVVRVDEVGRAEAVQYDAWPYRPQATEIRYFLTQFVVRHFSRLRATVQRDFPASLFFLESSLLDATIAGNDQNRVIETFVTNPGADEVDVAVQNVTLSEISAPPFKASVNFQRLYYSAGTRAEHKRETYVAQIDFAFRESIPNELVPVNPLGLQITYFRVDQAFEEERR